MTLTDGRVLGLPSTLGGVPLETRLAELGLGDGTSLSVCVREGESVRERVCVSVCERERVCVCVREREIERVSGCVSESECVSERDSVCVRESRHAPEGRGEALLSGGCRSKHASQSSASPTVHFKCTHLQLINSISIKITTR